MPCSFLKYLINYAINSCEYIAAANEGDAVAVAAEACKQAGAKRVVVLPVSAPFHCSLMKNAAEKMKEKINKTDFLKPLMKNNWIFLITFNKKILLFNNPSILIVSDLYITS